MSHYIKKCPECGEVNDVLNSNCISCGCGLQVVIPEEVNDENDNNVNEDVVKNKIRYYKHCRVCGKNNYFDNSDDYIPNCEFCQSEDINDEPTLVEEETQEQEVVNEEIKPNEVAPKVNCESKVVVTPLRLFDFNENVYVDVPKEGGIIGRYGSIKTDYFSKYDHVSGNHLRVINQDGEFYVQDLNSTNGTKINGKKLHSMIKYKINNGDLLEISILIFEVVK